MTSCEFPHRRRFVGTHVLMMVAAGLSACSIASPPVPLEVPVSSAMPSVQKAWTVHLPAAGPAGLALPPNVSGSVITVAAPDGTVLAIDALTGREQWRAQVGARLLAGAGGDGTMAAVVTTDNRLLALENGRVVWTQRLAALTYTAPLLADGRIFVQTADRTVSAWDARSGHRLWSQRRAADNLVLGKPGVLLAVGDTVITGVGGRLAGLKADDGTARWVASIASPRGINDVDRLVDVTGTVSRDDNSVCARAYDAAVGCVDAATGLQRWTQPAQGSEGLGGDRSFVYGSESTGSVIAWRRSDGKSAWRSELFKNRALTSPLVVGNVLAIAERSGTVYFISRADGSLLNKVTPDGSAISAAPVLSGNTVVVLTQGGGIFGYRIQ